MVNICYAKFLKLARDEVNFPSAERSFQALAPLKEKHFWPVFEFFLGSLKSVSVFLRNFQVSWDALVNNAIGWMLMVGCDSQQISKVLLCCSLLIR